MKLCHVCNEKKKITVMYGIKTEKPVRMCNHCGRKPENYHIRLLNAKLPPPKPVEKPFPLEAIDGGIIDPFVFHRREERRVLKARRARLKKYGLTEQQYNIMVAEQQGLCKICKTSPERLVIDHCHETGEVRGLLCHYCNVGLGWFRDSTDSLKSAIKYLNSTESVV